MRTWIASARSEAMSLREMRERILDMTSGRERPLTKTLSGEICY